MPSRGLVIGKFYPPHRGHHHLIRSGLAHCDELFVMIGAKADQVPGGELRATWLREVHPTARVVLMDDRIEQDDSRLWAEECIRILGFRPDVVFTSEDYGESFAFHLGCRHVSVDRERSAFPVSGTRVRADPFACWEYLEGPVRAHYAFRVCLIGAESTGKTTLAQALAAALETEWVPEYGRELSEEMMDRDGEYRWTSADFVRIAETQCARENAAARRANRVLVCDTDALATAIWHRHYMGNVSPEVEAIAAAQRRPDLYLVPDINTPFVQDGYRDGEAVRHRMQQWFLDRLRADGRPYVEVSGTREQRLQQSLTAIHQRMGSPDSNPGVERSEADGN